MIAEPEVKKRAPRPKLLLDSIKFLRQSYNVTPILKMAQAIDPQAKLILPISKISCEGGSVKKKSIC